MPASDDDEEAIGDNSLQGIDRQKEVFIIEAIIRTLGCTEEVIMMTAKQLKLSEGVLFNINQHCGFCHVVVRVLAESHGKYSMQIWYTSKWV